MSRDLNYIDLFAGGGGLSEGFVKAGFNPVAHIEIDANACKTLRTRAAFHFLKNQNQLELYYNYITQKVSVEEFYKHVPKELLDSVLNFEISNNSIEELFHRIDYLRDGKKIDIIVGGPPCQVYSLVGRSRIGNDKVHEDKRYNLYKYYGQFLMKFRPKYFVFENVQGLLSAGNRQLINDIESFLEECGYKVKYQLLNASYFGVLQSRKRVILIGRKGKRDFNYPEFKEIETNWSVQKALFSDLKKIDSGDTRPIKGYTLKEANGYLKGFGIRSDVDFVTQHITRPHIERDLEIYSIAIKKWINDRERLKYSDLPNKLKTHHNENSFLDRYKVVDGSGISHTIVAHIGKDGHYFIYPDMNNPRSLSIREAARIQSFSDDYFFEGGRTSAFKQIGNAVPPLMAFELAKKIKNTLC